MDIYVNDLIKYIDKKIEELDNNILKETKRKLHDVSEKESVLIVINDNIDILRMKLVKYIRAKGSIKELMKEIE